MSDPQQTLSQISPRTAWEPFVPTRRSRWDAVKASHLLRRAAFGASWSEIERAVQEGPETTLDRVIRGGPGLAEFDDDADRLAAGAVNSGEAQQLEAAWMHRLLNSPHPLQERLTLFWHDHFATSQAKVEDLRLMQQQNSTLRHQALGNFPEMLHAMTRDPAMLVWLDSNTNRKGAPNENYAREVFELFSLGLGQYSEDDIKEAARALTGWSVKSGDAFFDPAQHDETEKTVFGQKGKFTSGDVVRLCLAHPGCSMFLVRKLFQEFISDAGRPSDELLQPLAEGFRQRDYDIAWVLRRMLGSWLFYSEASIQQRVKSPVELIVGTVKAFEGRMSPLRASQTVADLGQRLFFPPSVKGWDGGRLWLNSTTLLRRQNVAFEITRGVGESSRCDPAKVADRYGASDAAALADFFLKLLLQTPDTAQRAALVKQLEDEAATQGQNPLARRPNAAHLARTAAHLALTIPEYQLG